MQSSLPLCIQKLGLIKGLRFQINKKLKKAASLKFTFLREPVYFRNIKIDYNVFMQLFVHNEYGFKVPIKPETIFDFGANIGLASVLFANKYPSAKIWALEPEEKNYLQANKNLENYKNVTLLKGAIWNESTHIDIIDDSVDVDAFMTKKSESGSGKIRAYTIDEILELSGQPTIDLLKIDVEGAEKEVFESNYENWIQRTKIIVIELHDEMKPGSSKAVFSAICKYDFSFAMWGENVIFYNKKYINKI